MFLIWKEKTQYINSNKQQKYYVQLMCSLQAYAAVCIYSAIRLKWIAFTLRRQFGALDPPKNWFLLNMSGCKRSSSFWWIYLSNNFTAYKWYESYINFHVKAVQKTYSWDAIDAHCILCLFCKIITSNAFSLTEFS